MRFDFKATNNQAEYEALIAGIILAKDMAVQNLVIHSDSQLVVSLLNGDYQAKDEQMQKYLAKVQRLLLAIPKYELNYVPRDSNRRADELAKLASMKKAGAHSSIIYATLQQPSILTDEVNLITHASPSWMTPILEVLNAEPGNLTQFSNAKRREASHYTILKGQLYRQGFTSPLLNVLHMNRQRAL